MVKVPTETGLPAHDCCHSVGCTGHIIGSYFPLDGRLHGASVLVKFHAAALSERLVPRITLSVGHFVVGIAIKKNVRCQFFTGLFALAKLRRGKTWIHNHRGNHLLGVLEGVQNLSSTRLAAFLGSCSLDVTSNLDLLGGACSTLVSVICPLCGGQLGL